MAAYAVGDVQGCYSALCRLLDKLRFDESSDELWLAGDLVNRGPHSAHTLRFVKSIPLARVVLGNHDLHLLAVAKGFRVPKPTDTFDDVLEATDCHELLGWLRQQPLLQLDAPRRCAMVHAGFHPSWSLDTAERLSRWVGAMLADHGRFPRLLERMYGNHPSAWSETMDEYDKGRWIINAFTRMRFCTAGGEMDFTHVGPPGTQPDGLFPWFQLLPRLEHRIIFGHWSLLGSGVHGMNVSLDSGCAHGGRLTAIDLDEDPVRFVQVSCTSR